MQTISSLRLSRVLCAGLALCSLSTAEARHLRHHVTYVDRARPDQGARPESDDALPGSQTSDFAVAITQVIRDCKEQATILQNTPTDVVIKTVRPTKEQLAAIEHVQNAANDAAKKLNASCPGDVPATLSERLATADQALGATKAALVMLRPAFVSAYATLDDEQKAQLVALEISNAQQSDPASSSPTRKNQASAHVPFGCEQWSALLKSWPLNRMEVDRSLSDEERAELYELMASVYHATGHLATSCQTTNALTPVARLDGEVNRIDILRQCIDGIAPALGEFTSSLNDAQKLRFNTALGITAQARTRSNAGDKE